MPFTETDVRDWVGPDTFRRAVALVPELRDVSWGEAAREGDLLATGRVEKPHAHETTLFRMRGVFSSTCSCPLRRNCVHGAALALALRVRAAVEEAPAPPPPVDPTTDWAERIARYAEPAGESAPAARTLFTYRLRWPVGPDGQPELQLQVSHATSPSFRALAWHLYRVGAGDPEPDVLVEPAIRRIRARKPQFRDGETRTAECWLVVPPEHLPDLLPKLALHPRVEDDRRRAIAIHPTLPLTAGLAYAEGPDGPRLAPAVLGPRGPVDRDEAALLGAPGARWVAASGALHPLDAAAEAAWGDTAPIQVPEAERAAFERRWLPALASAGKLHDARRKPVGVWPQGVPKPQLLLVEDGDGLLLRVGFVYGESRLESPWENPPHITDALAGPAGGALVRRDWTAEVRWLDHLHKLVKAERLGLDDALEFLDTGLKVLTGLGWDVVGSDGLKKLRIAPGRPTGQLSIRTHTDWFDIHSEVIMGAEKVSWQALKRSLETGARFVKLGDGTWGRLPADWLADQRRLRERLGAKAKDAEAMKPLEIPFHLMPLLAEIVDAEEAVAFDAGFTALRERWGRGAATGAIAEAAPPEGFTGTLRSYQRQGLGYLRFLRETGLHGILADDMGLGKTVQATALLVSNRATATAPSLIVAPTSVVENWSRELARFAPGLRVLKLHGPGRDVSEIDQYDVVITTYATARLDLAAHRAHTYDTVILDEAQAIKNPRSQTAIAMRRLRASHRLCLTGTPIENDARDVWSLFAFLMPGMLGSDVDFRSRYAIPLTIGDPVARESLKKRIAPFILRRLKREVAPELPPRTDITLMCELTPGQRRAYDAVLTGAREKIQRAVEVQGLDSSRMTILESLLKLREACCHPALLATPETMALGSGKLDAAMALIAELSANGHRAIVFSQFTRMLAILRERLDAEGLAYEYLDGRTRDRQATVDRFNGGTAPLFLISLKAGGTGLNVTGADYVIHYDPWWNPAIEDQATDRAHRIGQTRHVFNYKLVAKDTIEEKLLALQAEKRGLVSDLLGTDATGKSITAEDLRALFG